MKKVLFAVAVLLAGCAAAVAANRIAEQVRQKAAAMAAPVKTELQARVDKTPLSLQELCSIEGARLTKREEDKEVDPLQSLYALRHSLIGKIQELNPYWKPEEKLRKELKYVHREYDITDLTTRPPDRPAPMIGLGYGPHLYGSTTRSGGGIISIGEEEEGRVTAGFDAELIFELLEKTLPEETKEERSIRYSGGKLICYVTEEDAKTVEEIIAQLRQTADYSINIEVKFMRATAKYLGEMRKGDGDSAIYLSPEAEKKLLDDIAQKKDVQLAASSEVIASDGQIVHIREGKQVSFLMDYDINMVGVPALRPVVKLVNEGLICQFAPTVIGGGKEVSIDVLASFSAIRKEVRKGDFMGGELQFPAMDMSQVQTGVRVPSGTAVLIGGTALASGDEKKESHNFIIYLKPTVNRMKK